MVREWKELGIGIYILKVFILGEVGFCLVKLVLVLGLGRSFVLICGGLVLLSFVCFFI